MPEGELTLEEVTLRNLKERYFQNKIYVSIKILVQLKTTSVHISYWLRFFYFFQTFNGNLLIAINPFEKLNIYSSNYINRYKKNPNEQPAHIYSIGANCLSLTQTQNNQSVVITGISGSGKTQSTKFLMKFLSNGSKNLSDHVAATMQILDSFSCAQTCENSNSSRLLKMFQVRKLASFSFF